MPFIADQPWWARRLEQHGLGPAALSRKTTNPQVIAAAIESAKGCSDALELAALQMAQEDGLAKALDILEQAEQGVFPFAPA
jgi:sterol 3beta-glucosyltransferase